MDNLTPVGDILTDSLIESPEPSGPTAKGLKASTAGIKSAGGGLAALAGTALHSPTIRDYGLGAVDRANTEAGDNSMRIEDIKDFGGAMDFAKYGAGYLLPQVMLSVLAGGVGRGLGAVAGRTTENLATKAFLRSAGTALGLAGSSVGQEVGSIYPEALQTGVANPETRALVGGAAAGALDVIPEAYLASRLNLFKNALSRSAQVAGPAGIARAAGAEALKTAALEGGTEGVQTAIERASAGQPLTGAEANSDYLNSIALGVLGGGILGAPTGAIHAMRGPETTPDNLAPLPTQPSEPQAPSIEAPTPTLQVTPDATPLDVPEGAYARLDGAVGDSLPDLNQLPYRPGQVPTEPVDAITLSQQAAALQQADAEIAATPERLAVGVLETEKANLLARQETLQAEAQLPKDQRRPMSAIVQEQRALAARLPDLDNQIKTQSLLADTPKYQPKGRLTEGQVLDQAPPPSPGVKLVGTPDFARTAEQVMADRRAGSPIVLPEQATPPTPEIILPEPSAGSGPRTRVTSDLNHPFAAPDPTPRPAASVPELPLETKYAAERAAASARTPQQFVNDAVNAVHAEATTMHYTLNKGTTKKLTAAIHAAATAPNPVEAFRDTFASTLASKAKSNPLRDLVEQVSAKLSGEVSEYNSKAAAETMSYLAISGKGREAIDYLRHILGTPGDLEVSLFEAPAGGPVGVARIGPFKSVIELAYNAKDVLSTAAHEGFHFLENKVLSKSEIAVVRRALAKGAPLRANLVQAVRAYDAENGTDILGQLGNQQEVNAYAYEFWKRGQFEARGILGKVFRKIKQILERVRNAIDGLGYTSIEDVFTAIDLGAYAVRQEAPNAVKYAPTPAEAWYGDVAADLVPSAYHILNRKVDLAGPARIKGAVSRAKGRPRWVNTPADLVKLRTMLRSLAIEGASARDWHARSGSAILSWANGDIGRAKMLAKLIATYSPRTPVGLDLRKAIATIELADKHEPIIVAAPKQQIDSAIGILQGGEVTGIKRQNFTRNLMLSIDPAHYNSDMQGATIDMWMAHAFLFANDAKGSVTESQYQFANAEVQELANRLGWHVEEAQAAIWVAIKARGNAVRGEMQKYALAHGWYENKTGKKAEQDLFGEEDSGTRWLKPEFERAYITKWMENAYLAPYSQEEFDKANYSYKEALDDYYAGRINQAISSALGDATETPGFKVPPQLSLFSKAAVADVVNRAAKGEVPYTQVMRETGNLLDSDELPDPTFKDVFGASRQAFGSSLSRWYLENVASGLEIARRSKGFANVFNVLTAYRQRKDRLISEGVDIQLSRWRNANGQDTAVVGKALLDRTVGAYTKDSPEYQAIRGKLTAEQRRMFDQAGLMISDRLGKEFLADQRSMKSILGADTPAYQEWFDNRAAQVQRLIDEGYVPERRYGDHIVNISIPVTGSDGRVRDVTLFNEQYASQAEATVRSKQYETLLAEAAPEMKVTYGYRYKAEHDASLSYQQFLDTARRQGVTLSQTERERLAKAMISSDSLRRNRIFRRKNVPGYSQDAMRVLSEFAVSMANKIAYSEFSSAIHDALEGMPVSTRMENGIPSITVEEGPDLWKADGPMGGAYRNITNERADFVMNPTPGNAVSSTLRAAASFNFLGGSLAAGMVQLSSLPMNTVPWLSQHAGYANAFGKTLAALKDTAANFSALTDPSKLEDGTVPIPAVDVVPGLRQALTSAAQDGTTLDTEIYQIMGLTRGGLLSKSRGVQQAISTWMAPFRLTEQVNRVSTFIAAYKVGAEKKLHGEALYKFAQDAVYNTQFRYDEVNRPGLAQSPWGSVLFTFKSYPLFMLETMGVLFRTKPSAATAMLLSMAVAAGVNGMPFAEDLMDLIDVVSQRLFGAPFNSRRALRNWFKQGSEAITGADLSGVLMNGVVNEATGLNFASRVGMGNLIPGTRLGAADADYANLMQEMLGPVGSLVTGWVKGVGSVTKGEFLTAIKQAAPLAARNLVKGGEQFATGFASDLGGRKLADVSTWEAFAQSIGFSSAALSRAYDLDRIDKQDKAFYEQMRGEFTKQIVQGVREGNQDLVREAVDSITAWNQAYPAMQMAVTPSAVRRQIIEAGLPLNQRTLMSLPRQLRGASMSLANNGVL